MLEDNFNVQEVFKGIFLIGQVLPAVQSYPESWKISTGAFWSNAMEWINVNFFDQLEAVKTFLLLNVLIPFKRFLLSLPWPSSIF